MDNQKTKNNTTSHNSSAANCYTPDDVKKLVAYILDWWEEHQYDTTGNYGEYNVYDTDPSFVVKAKLMREKGV